MSDYYQTCPFPKPKPGKKKTLTNGWKDKANRVCYYCGKRGAERHEVFAGMNRQISIREGFQVDLCPEHHRQLQDNVTPWGKAENKLLKADFERKYIRKVVGYGMTEQQGLVMWMQLIGRNYCEEYDPE